MYKRYIPALLALILAGCDGSGAGEKDGGGQDGGRVDGGSADADTDSDKDGDGDSDADAGADTGGNPDGSGAYQWHTFFGTVIEDFGDDIAADTDGNLYILGKSFRSWTGPEGENPLNDFKGSDDIAVLKLNSDGTYQWHTFYGSDDDSWPWGPYLSGSDFAADMVVDDSGNVYVTGFCHVGWTGPEGQAPLNNFYDSGDLFILKIDSEGTYQWHTFYRMEYEDFVWAMDVDEKGSIYLTGNCYNEWTGPEGQGPLHAFTQGETNAYILKIDTDGDYEWHTFYQDISGLGIAIDSFGDILISGMSRDGWNGPDGQMPLNQFHHGVKGMNDACILKLSDDGDYVWHIFYGTSGDDYGVTIVVDKDGNAYTTIISDSLWEGPSGEDPIYEPDLGSNSVKCLLKLSSEGKYGWHLCNEHIYGHSLDVNEKGEIFLAGTSYTNWSGPSGQYPLHENDGTSGYVDIHVIKLDKTGHYEWHTFYGSDKDDYGINIALDDNRGLWITGTSDASWPGPGGQSPLNAYSGDSDITILKLRQ